MKHTQNMTERAARAEALLERAMQCIETTHRHHACAGCTDEVRAVRDLWAAHQADQGTLEMNGVEPAGGWIAENVRLRAVVVRTARHFEGTDAPLGAAARAALGVEA